MAALVATGCGGSDTGILVAVLADPAVSPPVDQLHFVIGVQQADGTFLKDQAHPDELVTLDGRDLTRDPYKLLLHDSAVPPAAASRVIVGVIGLAGGAEIAFGGFDQAQQFMSGKVIQRDVLLTAATNGAGFTTTATGCLLYGAITIAAREDRDCDGDPATTDCDDTDPTVSSTAVEVCGNGVDDNCDLTTDEGCGACTVATDCDDALGPPPCGTWTCDTAGGAGRCQLDCPGCTDMDGDGYGTETTPGACAGADCDDTDEDITLTAPAATCYSSDSGTIGVGVCQAGTTMCTDGQWSPCSGEVTPSGEACNAEDDDCNGAADDMLGSFACGLGVCATTVTACTGGNVGTCVPLATPVSNDASCDGLDSDCDGAVDEDCACVHVAPSGNDALAIMTANGSPFLSIQAAIDWAATTPGVPQIVCVAPGATCGVAANFDGAVTMVNGVSVYGGYQSTTWGRCTGPSANDKTVIRPGTATGVLFPNTVVLPTGLDGVKVDRAALATTAGITVDGAVNVMLSNVLVTNTPSVMHSYGVNLVNDGKAMITRSTIYGGNGALETVGVRAVASRPLIVGNCPSLNAATGQCDDWCLDGFPQIRGKMSDGDGASYAVHLVDSPRSRIEQSSLCSNNQDVGAVIRVDGDGAGVAIRANQISAFAGQTDSHGVWLEDCAGAAPWIVDNNRIESTGALPTTRVDAIRAIGDCHPVIDSNTLIVGGAEGGTAGTNGVHCGANALGVASQCVVLGNPSIMGAGFGYPPTAVGVRCDGDGCNRIAGNIINGNSGVDVWGLYLDKSGAFVDRNRIIGGCGTASSTAVFAQNSWARLQNNQLFGGTCNAGSSAAGAFSGLHVVNGSSGADIDVHSNDIFGGGNAAPCVSMGVRLDIGLVGPPGGRGIFRNNIISGGPCATAYGFKEAATAADPRTFENNDLTPLDTPTALYFDEDATALATAAAVDALLDMTVGGTLSADPQFVSFPNDLHLAAGSICEGAGTPTGAPAYDMDGHPRDPVTPDIGADEL